MCNCQLPIEGTVQDPIIYQPEPHNLVYRNGLDAKVLLEGFLLEGKMDYAAIHQIEGEYGVKRGYLIVIGEKNGR